MSIAYAYSTKASVQDAVEDIRTQFGSLDPKLVIYFASTSFDAEDISRSIQNAYPAATTFGCSTAGEIVSGHMLKRSVVAMGFDSQVIGDVAVEVIENVREENQVPQAFERFEQHFGKSMRDLDFQKYVGIILVDGLSRSEERLMDTIGDLTNVVFIGGSAGDDLKFQKTYLYSQGKVYSNAAILALLQPKVGFDFIKTQSFRPLEKELVATRVDEASRTVLEFNNIPAVEAYAAAVGTPVADAPGKFMSHPIGLMAGDEPYVRSPQQVSGNSIVFYCNVMEGMNLSLLQSTDIVEDTKLAVAQKAEELGGIAAIINFHCILRTLELEQKGQTEQYGKLFSNIPTIGFSTYGEEFVGHINQTSTMLVFKDN
jgi:hypothetical protein